MPKTILRNIELSSNRFFKVVVVLIEKEDYATAYKILNNYLLSGQEMKSQYDDFLLRFLMMAIEVRDKESYGDVVKNASYIYLHHKKYLVKLSNTIFDYIFTKVIIAYLSEKNYGEEALYYADRCIAVKKKSGNVEIGKVYLMKSIILEEQRDPEKAEENLNLAKEFGIDWYEKK